MQSVGFEGLGFRLGVYGSRFAGEALRICLFLVERLRL